MPQIATGAAGAADAAGAVPGAGAVDIAGDDGYALLVGAATVAALRTAVAMWQRQGGTGPISAPFLTQVQRLRSGLI